MGGPEGVAIIAAVIALVGVLITAAISLRTHQELRRDRRREVESSQTRAEQDARDTERRDRREHAIEIYQWAAELAVSPDSLKAQVGVDALKGLLEGNLLDDDTKLLVETALASATAAPVKAIERALGDGEDVRVVQVDLEAIDVIDVALDSGEQPELGDGKDREVERG